MTLNHGERLSKSATTKDTSFDSFLTTFPIGVDPRLSSAISSQEHVDWTHSGSQARELFHTESVRPLRETASAKTIHSTRKKKTPTYSSQNLTQYSTGVEPSDFWSDKNPDSSTWDSNQRVIDVIAQENAACGFMANTDLQCNDASGQELLVTSVFGDGLSGDLDFGSSCGSFMSPNLSTCIPKDHIVTPGEQGAIGSIRNAHDFSIGTSGNVACTLSPMSKCRLSVEKFQDTLPGTESRSDTGTTCMILALKILQALHIPRSACLHAYSGTRMNTPRQPRTVDSVLSISRNIVPLVSDMVKCDCFLNSQVQLVFTIICGKLMAWYRATIQRGYDGYENSSKGRSVVNENISDEDYTKRVSHQPINIGGYSFDVVLEGKILAQVVSSELQHLERLVQDISMRIQETRFGEFCTDTASRSEGAVAAELGLQTSNETGQAAGTTPGNLIDFLNGQMQAVKAEVSSYIQ